MEKNVQRLVFLTTQLKGLYVVLSFMAHLDSTAVGATSTSLILRFAVMDTGFGVTAPSTMTGKVLLVFYGLLGCSATILFFNLFLERVITLLSLLILWCHSKRTRHGRLECRGSESDRNEEWKPSVYQVTLVLFVAVLVVAFGAASLYSTMEGWTYLESLYFCFVAFSTVGFGDFVSGQREHHEDTQVYQVANCLLMLLGVCCTYSLFNAISLIIKQGLNWMLRALAKMEELAVCVYLQLPSSELSSGGGPAEHRPKSADSV
ncbi:potassium channel subfamily K member 13 [Scomber scombrus]|uniref:potassium channel subfamily K member 13 n=1 Tax=Scomber scombrus TaxID=13677 RepID=UPI002DD8415D|nr:potassium channel subfamily K member 13 [Scomber scombrus]